MARSGFTDRRAQPPGRTSQTNRKDDAITVNAPPDIVTRLRAAGCVFAEEEASLLVDAAETPDHLESLVRRRLAGEPLEVIVGWAEFAGLRIAVEPGAFVPRSRTRFLVERAIELARDGGRAHPVIVDLCCGTGAMGAAVLEALPGAEVYASDIDPVEVRVARRNLPADRVFEGDLFDALPSHLRGRVDILVVNAPYVPTDEIELMPAEARDHEHRVALDGGADGLDLQRRVAAGASAWLRDGGCLLVETSVRQAPASAALFEENLLDPQVEHADEFDATVVIGRYRA